MNTVEFENTFMQSAIETGTGVVERPNEVSMVGTDVVPLVRVYCGNVAIYMNVATARSLAEQILHVTDNGCDPLWATEPATGEEEDRWAEDIRAGAIGGDVK